MSRVGRLFHGPSSFLLGFGLVDDTLDVRFIFSGLLDDLSMGFVLSDTALFDAVALFPTFSILMADDYSFLYLMMVDILLFLLMLGSIIIVR